MKILIVTMNVGGTAPGIVFEKIIRGLSEIYEIDILTAECSPEISLPKVNNIIIYDYKFTHYNLNRAFFSILSFNPVDSYYSRKVRKKIHDSYDLIFSFISSGHTLPLQICENLHERTKTKHFTYFVDAIPAPKEWWLGKNLYYIGTRLFIKRKLKFVDGIFASNNKMLEYQKNMLKSSKKIKSGVIFNPVIETNSLKTHYHSGKCNIFLYTGNIYGLRTIKHLSKAFLMLLNEYPDSKLQFIGSILPDIEIKKLPMRVKQKIELINFNKDLQPYYEQATALLDIDAELENDVFMSSKITNYLSINKPIICETGLESPSRELFKNSSSIIQCSHDGKELYEAMKYVIEKKNQINYDDRKEIIQRFSLDNVIADLECAIENTINKI